jgi:nicotinamidase-related amidase
MTPPPGKTTPRTKKNPTRSQNEGASAAMLLVSVGFCAGLAFYRFALESVVLKKRRKKREVDRVARRSVALREGKDAIEGETYVQCKGGEGESMKNDKSEEKEKDFLSKSGRLGQHYSRDVLERLEATTANVARVLEKCREKGFTIAHSRSHRYGAEIRRDLLNGIDVSMSSPIEGVDATYNFVERLKPKEGEIIVDKWTFGAFASTDLEKQLVGRGVERILLCGILTNVCVMATAVQACDRLFRVCLVEDACGAFGKEKEGGWHDMAVTLINGPQIAKQNHHKSVGLYFGEVATVDAVVEALDVLK